MPVGSTIGSSQIDNIITSLAVRLRNVMRDITNLDLSVNGQGTGLAYLESVGYSAIADPANPGGISDAQYALDMITHLRGIAGVYFGAATQDTAFSFDKALAQIWAGQVSTSP